MEYSRGSEFPHYEDGDVAILVTPLKTYQLHSNVLRRYSPYFANVFDQQQAANLSAKARRDGVTTRYRLQLVKTQSGAIGSFQRLVRMVVFSLTRSPTKLSYLACRQPRSLTFGWPLPVSHRQWAGP